MMKDFGTFRTEGFMSESDFVGATDKRNHEGYHDPVPYLVMKNDAEYLRFRRFIDVIFKVARLCGFYITGKIVVSDNFTGKKFEWVFKPRR